MVLSIRYETPGSLMCVWSGLRWSFFSVALWAGLNGQRDKCILIPDLQLFPLIRRPETGRRTRLGQKFLRLERHIEQCRGLRNVRELPVVLADVGTRAVPGVHGADDQMQNRALDGDPACGGFLIPLIRGMTQVEVHTFCRLSQRERR